jgi:Lipopolysaccharide-assembly
LTAVVRPALLIGLALAGTCVGCYSLGFEPEAGLEELAVPVFQNTTLRRNLEHDLTRHVRREVLETTPLQLGREGSAERVLRGRILEVREAVLISGSAEDVLESSVTVEVGFGVFDAEGALVLGEDLDQDGVPDGEFRLTGYAEFNTRRGESRETATDEALRDVAEMIVFRLERRVDDRWEPNDTAARARPLRLGRHEGLIQREDDWFRLTVPPGLELHVDLEGATLDADDVGLELTTLAGAPLLPDAPRRAYQAVLPAADEEREACVHVTGAGRGSRYRLRLRVFPPD